MSGEPLAFVDTNILVYAFHRADDPRHHTAQQLYERLLRQGGFCVDKCERLTAHKFRRD